MKILNVNKTTEFLNFETTENAEGPACDTKLTCNREQGSNCGKPSSSIRTELWPFENLTFAGGIKASRAIVFHVFRTFAMTSCFNFDSSSQRGTIGTQLLLGALACHTFTIGLPHMDWWTSAERSGDDTNRIGRTNECNAPTDAFFQPEENDREFHYMCACALTSATYRYNTRP